MPCSCQRPKEPRIEELEIAEDIEMVDVRSRDDTAFRGRHSPVLPAILGALPRQVNAAEGYFRGVGSVVKL